MKRGSNSPIKDPPLRLPGQSLMEERHRLWDDKIEPWVLMAAFMIALSVLEWWRFYRNDPFNPWLFSVVAALAVAIAAWKLFCQRPRMRQLQQAIEGEKAVGQFLDRLRERGYSVFHDVLGASFNVDHVLIGPGGVFTVETKTWTKPRNGDARITFDGERIQAGAHVPDRDPVVQARAQASWLRGVITESTGRQVAVFPIVLFPGWYVEQGAASRSSIWLLEPKALPAFLEREPQRLSAEDRKLVAYHLMRFIRSEERLRSR